MIGWMRESSQQYVMLIIHVLLGVFAVYVPELLIVWVYSILISIGFTLITSGNSTGVVHFFLAYYIGIEILVRIAKASPIIPYESGKYFMFIFLVLGIMLSKKRGRGASVGYVFFALLIPSFFIMPINATYKDFAFNILGMINLSLAVIYFSSVRVTPDQLKSLLRLIMFGIVAVLTSVIVKTPDFEDVIFNLSANFETSAGFGSNQVSTILGFGILILGFCYLTDFNPFEKKWIPLLLIGTLFFRGLLTFSRGGIVGALLVLVIVFLAKTYFSPKRSFKSGGIFRIVLASSFLVIVFVYANNITSDVLLQRYQGETNATLAGRREKDLSVLSSNRIDIFYSDLTIWQDNFIFGIGPGMAKYNRTGFGNMQIAAHVEPSRLLAEHGLFGFFICVLLFCYPLYKIPNQRIVFLKLFSIAMFGYSIFTSFHSAMRTNVTPLLYGMAIISIFYAFKNESTQVLPNQQLDFKDGNNENSEA